jgi:apolipoprotein D and lipocalin family protein
MRAVGLCFRNLMQPNRYLILALLTAGLTSCQNGQSVKVATLEPLQAMSRPIELAKFMGDWYVIAHIPTFIEKEAYNAVESYKLKDDGTIATTFTFNQGRSDGPVKTYRPRGWVHNHETRTEWRMQFLWPFQASFLINEFDESAGITVIGVPDRSYVWIMARSKTIPEARYSELVKELERTGHDVSKLRRVPQN